MKYWKKTYLATLLLFLLALNFGAYLLFHAAFGTTLQAERDRGFAEHAFIRDGLNKDIASLLEHGSGSDMALDSLFQTYRIFYARQSIHILLQDTQGRRWADITEPDIELTAAADGSLTSVIVTVEETPNLYVRSVMPDIGYTLTTVRSVAALHMRINELSSTLIIGSVALSVLLSAALYLILKRLTKPIQTLSRAALTLANGDYGIRAVVSGKDELAELALRFNTMADKIQQQIAELMCEAEKKQRFIDDLAHEMRTPLSAIGGYAQYLATAAITEEERSSAFAYIFRESARLADMSEKLLTLTMLRNQEVQLKDVPLRHLFADLERAVKNMAADRHVVLNFDIADVKWRGDETLLYMLLLNLIKNAVDACSENGAVHIHANAIEITVKDSGCGMDKKALTRATEPFFRVDASRSRKAGGTGLGLSICQSICASLHYKLMISSVLGTGTTVSVLQADDNFMTTL